MSLPVGRNPEMEQLRSMLLQPEAERLKILEQHVADLQLYVGGKERLEAATADILAGALERAEGTQPRELANAIAPIVVAAIRKEIENSRDLMVEALYPITGRMVGAAVANAVKELLAYIEQRLNALTSTDLWVARIKSTVTGRPISEFVLADGQALQIDRLLMIERGSGRLICDWIRNDIPDAQADLRSAMVAAILEFSVQALDGAGQLQTLDFGGREIMLRASPRFILAAECRGASRASDAARINALFFDTVEQMDRGATCDAAMLGGLAQALEAAPVRTGKPKRGKIILYVLLAIGGALLAWQAERWMSRTVIEQRVHEAMERFTERSPLLSSFPVALAFDHDNRTVVVTGLVSTDVDGAQLMAELAAAAEPYGVDDRLARVPGMNAVVSAAPAGQNR